MAQKKQSHVSKKKINAVKELGDFIKKKRTILITSIKGIPASQYQEIAKKFRKDAEIRVSKKNLVFKAIDDSGNEELKKIKDYAKENFAVIFSDIETFELAEKLLSKKIPAKAKAGQEAPEDIEIHAGPTDLVPGPAISELGAFGIQIQIEKGKITIKESKVIVKKGQKISSGAADVMNKLDIKPFSIGFVPLASFDNSEKKLYVNIKIDKEKTLKDLITTFRKSLGFAVNIHYPSKETIKVLIAKAGVQGNSIKKISEKTEVQEQTQ